MTSNLITDLLQICIVSENLEETVQRLADNFGIGPWKCWDFRPPAILGTHRNGEPENWTFKQAIAWVGGVQLEVIESTSGATAYRDYIDKHGECIHHLLVDTKPSYHDATQAFERLDYPVIQAAKINPPMLVGSVTLPPLPGLIAKTYATQFVYLDTEEDLGTVLELAKMPPGISFPMAVRLGKPDFTINPATNGPKIEQIDRVGIVVPDLDKAVTNWESVGIAPWVEGTDTNARTAAATLSPLTIELVQPTGDGVYKSLLDTQGAGVRFLQVSGIDAAKFAELDCPQIASTESGTFFDARSLVHTVFRI